MVGTQHHGFVDILHGGGTCLYQTDGVVDHGDQQLVDHETGRLLDLDGVLAQILGQVVSKFKDLVGGIDAADDFHQLHAGDRVEEVHADQGVLQTVSHVGDGQRRCVGGEDSLGLAQLVQLLQQGLLGSHLLLDALDDQIGIGGGGLLVHDDVDQQSVNGLLSHLAAGNALGQVSGQLILVALSGSDAAGENQGGVSLRSESLGDADAHGAGAENSYLHEEILLNL